MVVCWFLQESFKVKENGLHEIWNANTAFYLMGQVDNNDFDLWYLKFVVAIIHSFMTDS